MKYHTTISTIIISVIILLVFTSLALWCVFSLDIYSPGSMVVDEVISLINNDSDYNFSFESMDRQLRSGIKLNNLEFEYKGKTVAKADYIRLYLNPLQLLLRLVSGKGELSVELSGADIYIDALFDGTKTAEKDSDSAGFSLSEIEKLVNGAESYDEELSSMFFYDYSYKLSAERVNVHYKSIFDAENARFALDIREKLDFSSFSFFLPELTIQNSDLSLAVTDFAFLADKDNGYVMSASFDSLSFEQAQIKAEAYDSALEMSFKDFASLDINHLPLTASMSSASIVYGDVNIDVGKTSMTTSADALSCVLLSYSAEAGEYRIDGLGTTLHLSMETLSEPLLQITSGAGLSVFQKDSELINLKGINAELQRSSVDSLSLLVDTITFTDSGLTNGFVEKAGGDGLFLNAVLSGNELSLEGGAGLFVEEGSEFLKSSSLDITFSSLLRDWKLVDLDIESDNIYFPYMQDYIHTEIRARDGVLSAELSYMDQIRIAVNSGERIEADISLFGFNLSNFYWAVEEHVPLFKRYIDEKTTISGSLSYDGTLKSGEMHSSLALNSIRFNESSFGLATRLDASFDEEKVLIDNFTLTSEIVRAQYAGAISLDTFFPEGQLAVSMTESGKRLFDVDFMLSQSKEYYFEASSPSLPGSSFNGSVNWAREGVVFSAGAINGREVQYPFDLTIDLNNRRIDLLSEGVIVSVDYDRKLDILISLDEFSLPVKSDDQLPVKLDGDISYLFDFEAQSITAESEGIRIIDLMIRNRPDFSFGFEFDEMGFRSDDLLFTDGLTYTLTGEAVYSASAKSFAATLGDDSERFNLSLVKETAGMSGILELIDMSLDKFGFDDAILNTKLVGWGSSAESFSFSGSLIITPVSDAGFSLNADLIVNPSLIRLEAIEYSKGDMSISSPAIYFDVLEGAAEGSVSMEYLRHNNDRVYPFKAALSFSSDLGESDNLVSFALSAPAMLDEGIRAEVNVEYVDIDNLSYSILDRQIIADITSSRVELSGNLLTGSYAFDTGAIDLSLIDNEILTIDITGRFGDGTFDLNLNNVAFELGSINFLYPFPLVVFEKGSIAYGDFILYGSFKDSHLFGNALVKSSDLNIWWLDEEYIRMGDVHVSVVDNFATTNNTPVMTINRETGEINKGYAVCQAALSNDNILDYYNIELFIPEGSSVHVWVPLYGQGMQIKSDVSGSFSIYSDLRKNHLSGDLILDNCVMAFGMDELPHWWQRGKMPVANEFNVKLRHNCSFVMPLGPDPIISAAFSENTDFTFAYDSMLGNISLGGSLGFRSGEIYYFEKNFYITEGNIEFRNTTSNRIDPIINLRARLRDFDADGNKVDIYLVLNNSSLTNINPSFESSPQKDLNEIMSILGEAILPSSTYGELNLSSVASLLSSGVDVMNRVGLINTGGGTANLSSTIRDSLNLDMFSIRTSIFRNIIFDTIFYSGTDNYSPIARYLNDTTIYLGKYLTPKLFLQGLIHLEATKNTQLSFMASDLSLDLEISLEWQTPLGTISFATSPQNFSIYNIFDSFALSYSHKIRF